MEKKKANLALAVSKKGNEFVMSLKLAKRLKNEPFGLMLKDRFFRDLFNLLSSYILLALCFILIKLKTYGYLDLKVISLYF